MRKVNPDVREFCKKYSVAQSKLTEVTKPQIALINRRIKEKDAEASEIEFLINRLTSDPLDYFFMKCPYTLEELKSRDRKVTIIIFKAILMEILYRKGYTFYAIGMYLGTVSKQNTHSNTRYFLVSNYESLQTHPLFMPFYKMVTLPGTVPIKISPRSRKTNIYPQKEDNEKSTRESSGISQSVPES